MSEPTRQELYDAYLTTTFAARNDLSPEGLERSARAFARELGAHLPADRSAPILEIGCGVGAFLLCCRDLGYREVSGIDVSAQQVAFCHELGFSQVERAEAREYLERGGGGFAAIVMSDVLEHLPKGEVLPVLRAAAARLRPGGRLVLRVPNMSNPLNLRTRYVDFTHEVGFSKETLGQVLRMSGLEVEKVEGAFAEDPRWLPRMVFDRLLWWLFRTLYRRTLHLKSEVVRGKNLVAVASKADASPSAGPPGL